MPSSTGSDVRTASQSAGERAVFVPPDGHSYRHDLRHPRPAGRGGIVFRCPKPPGGPACFFPSNALTGPETQVTVRKPQALLLSLAVALALSACTGDKTDNAATADAADGATEAPALTQIGRAPCRERVCQDV